MLDRWVGSALVFALVITSSQGAEHTKDSLDAVKKAIADDKAVLVDVREKAEWDEGHLKSAKNITLSDLQAGIKVEDLLRIVPKGKIIYCHCAAGRRCLKAAELLEKHGYDVRPLKPGYKALIEAGFPKDAK